VTNGIGSPCGGAVAGQHFSVAFPQAVASGLHFIAGAWGRQGRKPRLSSGRNAGVPASRNALESTMPQVQSTARRHPALSALTGIAFAVATFAAGPVLADPASELTRVEVQGRTVEAPVRYDVHAACAGFEAQLQDALQTAWIRERYSGHVLVQFVMEGGQISAVKASGTTFSAQRSVSRAVQDLRCGLQAQAQPQIYRFRVDFIDPDSQPYRSADAQVAGAPSAVRIARLDN
jgi:hypothetical protein